MKYHEFWTNYHIFVKLDTDMPKHFGEAGSYTIKHTGDV
jgi:hypothetical protein